MLLFVLNSPEETDKFNLLYKKYYHLVFYILDSIVHDKWTAEDLMQETFLRLSQNLHKIGSVDQLETKYYIITIAKHLAFDHLDSAKKMTYTSMDHLNESSIFVEEDVLAFCIETEEYEMLLAMIAQLKDIDKIPLQLKYINHLSTKEIARVLDLPAETVKKRITRAKTQLQTLLNEKKKGGISV